MKKYWGILLVLVGILLPAQYLIVGKDSISAKKFEEENKYGLNNVGIEKTVASYVDFKLLQEYALSKKADTLSYFRAKMYERERQLREEHFYPKEIKETLLADYLAASKTEKKILIFYVEKAENDLNNYQKIYDEVISGKQTIEDAISTYTKVKPDPFFTKVGVFDIGLDKELQNLTAGSYTKLVNNKNIAAFAKLIEKRQSLGNITFGTLTIPDDANAEKTKKEVIEALQSGKKFQEITQTFGTTENEKQNGGIVSGSPALPDVVYNAFKEKKAGETTAPILIGKNWYFLHIYNIIPFDTSVSEDHKAQFIKDMMDSQYADLAYEKLVKLLISKKDYKEYNDFSTIKKSYLDFSKLKNDETVLYQFGKTKYTLGKLRKAISENFKNPNLLPKDQWPAFIDGKRDNDLFEAYSTAFLELPEVKEELNVTKQNLLADYLYSHWIVNELKSKPELEKEFFEKNKSKYILEKRAKGRVAIISDEKLKKSVKNKISNIQDWEPLKAQYKDQLNDKNQILVHFEEGEMSENAEIFMKYKVPFKKGVHQVQLQDRILLIAVDEILDAKPMTQEEASAQLKDDVTEEILQKAVAEQRKITPVIIEPNFINTLEKNFKK